MKEADCKPGQRLRIVQAPPRVLVSSTPPWLLGKTAEFIREVETPFGPRARIKVDGKEQTVSFQWLSGSPK